MAPPDLGYGNDHIWSHSKKLMWATLLDRVVAHISFLPSTLDSCPGREPELHGLVSREPLTVQSCPGGGVRGWQQKRRRSLVLPPSEGPRYRGAQRDLGLRDQTITTGKDGLLVQIPPPAVSAVEMLMSSSELKKNSSPSNPNRY